MENPSPPTSAFSMSGTLQMDLTGLIVAAVITAIGYFAVIDPLIDAQASRRLGNLELVARQERFNKQAAAVNSLAQDLANMKRAASGVPAFSTLPANQSNQRLADLTHLAATANLNVDEMRTSTPVSSDRFQIVPIHLAGSGTFQHCTSFLHQLRKAFPDTAVSGLKIAKQPDMPPEYATFRFQLSWYASPLGRTEVAAAPPS